MRKPRARHRRRTLSALAAFCALIALVGLGMAATTPSPAVAATTGAGYSGITPWGGYLGNYIAPDGSRVYCMDSAADWPSGATSGGTLVGELATEWGGALSAMTLRRLNYALLKWGQTADPTLAAALDAYIYSYTSTGALYYGAGYGTGATYIDGNVAVLTDYNAIWTEAESWVPPVAGVATMVIHMDDSYLGRVVVTASPADATGTLVLSGAVVASTGLTTAAVVDGSVIEIRGTPVDSATKYSITANATFTAAGGPDPNVIIYTTGNEQRTIRGGTSSALPFSAASYTTDPLFVVFEPVVTTHATARILPGDTFGDVVSAGVAAGSLSWRTKTDGTYNSVHAVGTLYGPFQEPPSLSDTVPAGAPVAGTSTIDLAGPGDYPVDSGIVALVGGYFTWVWQIEAGDQSPVVKSLLPDSYSFVDRFGIASETQRVPMRISASSAVSAAEVGIGVSITDALTVSLDSGAWLTQDGAPVPATFLGTAYFVAGGVAPAVSSTVPSGAQVIAVSTIVAEGPGTYSTPVGVVPAGMSAGFLTWVWHLSESGPFADYFLPWTDVFGLPGETTRVNPPTVSTVSATSAALGDATHDSALIAGASPPVGAYLVFQAYLQPDPAAARCDSSTLAFDSTSNPIAVDGTGTYDSPDATFNYSGTYFWVESLFSAGDELIHEGVCGTPSESTVVSAPTVSSTSTPVVTLGDPAHDVATVAGLVPTGAQLVFAAYRQTTSSATCTSTTLAFSTARSPMPIESAGDFRSLDTVFTQLGNYLWIETVLDRNGATIAEGTCGAEDETTTVYPAALANTGSPEADGTGARPILAIGLGFIAVGLLVRGLLSRGRLRRHVAT